MDELISITPISAWSMCDWLIVAAGFLQQETDMFLSHDANVKNYRCLEEVRDNVNVEEEIMLEPWQNEEHPCDTHRHEDECEHDETKNK